MIDKLIDFLESGRGMLLCIFFFILSHAVINYEIDNYKIADCNRKYASKFEKDMCMQKVKIDRNLRDTAMAAGLATGVSLSVSTVK